MWSLQRDSMNAAAFICLAFADISNIELNFSKIKRGQDASDESGGATASKYFVQLFAG